MERNFSLRSNSNEFLKKSIFVSFQTRIKVYLKRRLLSTNQKKKILPKCCRAKIIIIIIFFFSIRISILYRWLEKMSSWSKFQSCFSLIFVHLIKIIFVNVTWNSNNNWIFHVCWKLSSFKLKLLFRNKKIFSLLDNNRSNSLNCLISIVGIFDRRNNWPALISYIDPISHNNEW